MLPADLKAKLEAEVQPGVRTFSDVTREYLRRGLQANPTHSHLSSWASAIGQLMGLLAQDCIALAPPNEAAAMLKVGAGKLLDAFGAEDIAKLDKTDRELAEAFAVTLAQRVLRASSDEKATGDISDRWRALADRHAEMEQPSLRATAQFRAIQQALGESHTPREDKPAAAAGDTARRGKRGR